MDSQEGHSQIKVLAGKKRIPKACNTCRHSKVKCDEQRPACGRCRSLNRECAYVERPKSSEEQKIERLEREVEQLRRQLSSSRNAQSSHSQTGPSSLSQHTFEATSPLSSISATHSSPYIPSGRPSKRKRFHFNAQQEITIPDFVTDGLLSESQATLCFNQFFDGCDRYVPSFDSSDTFISVRTRSSLLFNVICAVGCGVTDEELIDSRSLRVRVTRWLPNVILSQRTHSLETIQALMVMACWWAERTLLLAIATRMAIELGLDDAFDELVNLSVANASAPECHNLMKRARTWALLWNLQQILQVDAGNLVGLRIKGARRCRTLLDKPFSTKLDCRLFSQVELNSLRIRISDSLTNQEDDLLHATQDARVNIAVWFDDWKRIMETSPFSGSELPLLLTNLTIQRHWADAMTACRAVRSTGLSNIDVMSDDQRQLLVMAKEALQNHLKVMLTQPQYLANFKYAMDFVWAKCAFSFLLLLKFIVLLPQNSDQHLLGQGKSLHSELTKYGGSGSSKVYLRLLELTIEKYEFRDNGSSSAELESFIPEEFIFEWDFPGLNLFSSPTGWDLLFNQYLLGDDLFAGVYD